jgi:hypothetical protein
MPATAIRRRRGRRREQARAKVRGDARSWSRRSAGRKPQAWEWSVPAGTRDNKSAAEIGERHLLVGRRRRLVRGRRRASSRMRRPITLTRRVGVGCESVSGLRRDLRFSWSQATYLAARRGRAHRRRSGSYAGCCPNGRIRYAGLVRWSSPEPPSGVFRRRHRGWKTRCRAGGRQRTSDSATVRCRLSQPKGAEGRRHESWLNAAPVVRRRS